MTQLLSNKQLLEGLLDETTIKKELVTELFGIGDSPLKKALSKLQKTDRELGVIALDIETEAVESKSSKLIFKAMELLQQASDELEREITIPVTDRAKFPGGLTPKGNERKGWKPSGEPGIHGGGFTFNPRKHA